MSLLLQKQKVCASRSSETFQNPISNLKQRTKTSTQTCALSCIMSTARASGGYNTFGNYGTQPTDAIQFPNRPKYLFIVYLKWINPSTFFWVWRWSALFSAPNNISITKVAYASAVSSETNDPQRRQRRLCQVRKRQNKQRCRKWKEKENFHNLV